VVIRDAAAGDVPAVARLLDQLGYPADEASVARRLERLLASSADRILVAESEGEVVGVAGIHVSPALEYDADAAKVSAIAVDEAHRGRGVGRALMAALEAEARARNCALLFLTTAERRQDAHAFYRALGFAETGRRFAKDLREL
jgi:N-acetylglutamate synthase-like GNAT family acetyltransferase